MRINLDDLQNIAIKCSSNEEAELLLITLRREGFIWGGFCACMGKMIIPYERTFWTDIDGGVYYTFDGRYVLTSKIEYCEEEGMEILTYKEAIEQLF